MLGAGRSAGVVAGLGAVGVLLLAGCSGGGDAGAAAPTVPTIPTQASASATTTSAAPTTATAPPASSAADPTGTSGGTGANGGTGGGGSGGTAATGASTGGNSTRSASQGCTPDGTGLPSGTVSKRTIDVDGDGRADTEWIKTPTASADDGSVLFGITTASGATFGARFSSASPIPRSAFFADATGSGEIVALASDGRQANLFVLDGCRLVPATNAQGNQYTFDLGFGTYGTGIGCSTVAGTSGRQLVGLKLTTDSDGNPVSVDRTAVELSGTRATNGPSDTVDVRGDALSDPAVATARAITCGALTASANGVSQPSA